jgi:hypothetical protein
MSLEQHRRPGDVVDDPNPGRRSSWGEVTGDSGNSQPFFITEQNGRWGTARTVPGFLALGDGAITAISCASAGNCTGVGNSRKSGQTTVFSISLTNGT